MNIFEKAPDQIGDTIAALACPASIEGTPPFAPGPIAAAATPGGAAPRPPCLPLIPTPYTLSAQGEGDAWR